MPKKGQFNYFYWPIQDQQFQIRYVPFYCLNLMTGNRFHNVQGDDPYNR